MPRLDAFGARAARIDQFNTHFTRSEYTMFLTLAAWRGQNPHVWLRETITRAYREFVRTERDSTRRTDIIAQVDAFLASVDEEAQQRRSRATTPSTATAPAAVTPSPPPAGASPTRPRRTGQMATQPTTTKRGVEGVTPAASAPTSAASNGPGLGPGLGPGHEAGYEAGYEVVATGALRAAPATQPLRPPTLRDRQDAEIDAWARTRAAARQAHNADGGVS